MSSLFVILLLISLFMLTWGLIAPKHLAKVSNQDITRKRAGLLFGGLSALFFVLVGVTAPANAQQSSNAASKVQHSATVSTKTTQKAPKPKITTKSEQTTQPIAFATQTVDDNTLAKGQTTITQAGVNGITTSTYEVTYSNGQETSRTLKSQAVTTPAVTQIVHNGTYIYVAPAITTPSPASCSNGYVNVNGNCVHSPSSDPSGATAMCGDGTYSYSQSRSGTCSHHGGVSRWL